jgi:prepilin-type N-terminal cleavage/methylation domain-containing protein
MTIDALRVDPGPRPGLRRPPVRWDRRGAAGRSSTAAHRGFTLIEATAATMLLGIAAAGVLLPFSGGAAAQAEGLRLTLAAQLAGDLMERIIATPPGQVMATWDGYAEAQGQVKDAGGAVFTDPIYANFSRRVTCHDDVYVPQQSGPPRPPDYVLVLVQTSYRGREMASLSRLISR